MEGGRRAGGWREQQQTSEAEPTASVLMDLLWLEGSGLHPGGTDS